MDDIFYTKVKLISKVKYDLDEEIVETFFDTIEECYENEFTPRRTVEFIAELINVDLNN